MYKMLVVLVVVGGGLGSDGRLGRFVGFGGWCSTVWVAGFETFGVASDNSNANTPRDAPTTVLPSGHAFDGRINVRVWKVVVEEVLTYHAQRVRYRYWI